MNHHNQSKTKKKNINENYEKLIETRELMEEVFPLTEQMNLLSETSRYALDNLLASHIINYGTKSNAKLSNNNSNIPNTNNNTCNNDTCSPLLSKKRQQSQHSFSRLQTAQGMEYTGTSKMKKNHVNHETLMSHSYSNPIFSLSLPLHLLFLYI